MKKRLFTMLLVVLMAIGSMFAFAACGPDEPEHTSHPDADNDGYCDIGKEKLPDDGKDDDDNKEYSAPVIKVVPEEMELTQGTSEDEYSLLFGVTVTDEYDKDLKATVKDDGGFDIDTLGDYTVTYTAKNSKGKESTAKRTYHVVAPLPNIVVEVQNKADFSADLANPGKWYWKHEEYYEISKDTVYDTNTPGVFHNTSTGEITLTVAGGYGQAAILNSAGVVVEGRDGTNGRLVDINHPVRANSPQGAKLTNAEGEEVKLDANFASWMKIPAGGFAIVLYTSTATFNQDGGKLMAERVIHQYGAAVKIYFEDKPDTLLCTYTDQAPVLMSADDVVVHQNDGTAKQDAEAMLLEDVSYVDDNGTWDIADDVKNGLTVSIVSSPESAYDNSKLATYTYKLKIVDKAGNETEFNRSIIVREADPVMPTISIGGKWFEFSEDKIAVNPKTVASATAYDVIIYNSYFEGECVVNNYAPYFIVDKNGTVVLTYHPVNGKYYEMGDDGAIQETAKANTNVLNGVEVPEGGYVVLAVYNNQFNDSMRAEIAKSDRMLGKSVEIFLFNVYPTVTVSEEGKEDKTWSGNNIYYNVDVDADKASGAAFLVYTKAFTGSFGCNGYGVAYVLNEEGKILRVYDATSGAPYYLDEDHYWPAGDGAGGARIPGDSTELPEAGRFAAGNYANIAFNNLKDGEILLVFPHSGTTDNNPRAFGGQFRQDFKKYTVSFSNFEIEVGGAQQPTDEKQIKIGSATLTVTDVAINENNAVTANYDVLIFTYEFTGTYTNDFGYAAVVKDGKIVRVYDGYSAKYFDADNTGGIKDETKCTAAGYAAEAIASLQTGEFVIIFPNSGKGGNDLRTWGGNNARTIGATVELVNITLA